jgi:hypothetical protein
VGLVYVAAFAASDGESVASVTKPFLPAPLGSEVRRDAEGFLTLTPKGIAEDFAQDLPDKEKQVWTATQGSTASAVFGADKSSSVARVNESAKQNGAQVASIIRRGEFNANTKRNSA